ncbi:hypothetical protein FGSG_12073 [Fusarium graminearum PH-1]|uniref:Chromosome 1, complete genome n=1 Tax=Gibberella zeae (strain ATCC MYA-4620 / CBS 123657 / FGSC 9075 / NRRL 31084 / PH-1) TaxID=229533 RepID=I1S5F5_GIBZE|nr:hypothetical protein FGSG_12073 [Fusarium graminearum PH-1]ESU07527.1 hypothetical protein FGSG_12073 [Fusarium graminearum PH-1]CEF74375.1 unnamed protein product [Fusarium graminearum]|eukprot:XP_011318012.1 hypothetical protein FGSG_12073 [Fusarium graminearum PH-1]
MAAPIPAAPANIRIPTATDIFIPVIGVTDSGKSSLISACSSKGPKIGHGGNACTSKIELYPYDASPGRFVWLIDTPGFEGLGKSYTQVVDHITRLLLEVYKLKVVLNGIIYLYRITGSAKIDLVTLKQLCGEDPPKKLAIATTMWDVVTNTLEATKRESELKNTWEFRSWMLFQGSSYHRYQNTGESARMIVNSLAGLDQPTHTISNKQLVKKTQRRIQTFVGQEVQRHLIEERKTFEERLRKAETYMREVNENETYLVMYQERCRYEKMFKVMESKTAALRANMEGLLAEKDQRINDLNLKIMRQQSDQALALARVESKQAQLMKRYDGYLVTGVGV